MQISINGERRKFNDDGLTILGLLEIEKVQSPDMVSVQLNNDVVDRSVYESTCLSEGDEVEFLYFMGGGAFR